MLQDTMRVHIYDEALFTFLVQPNDVDCEGNDYCNKYADHSN